MNDIGRDIFNNEIRNDYQNALSITEINKKEIQNALEDFLLMPIERIVSCEKMNDEIALLLDDEAGIDALAVCNGIIFPIALRVNMFNPFLGPFYDVTIRNSKVSGNTTELDKRIVTLLGRGLMPAVHVQIECDRRNGNVTNINSVWEKDLIEFIMSGGGHKRINDDNSSLISVRAKDMPEMKIYRVPLINSYMKNRLSD